MVCKFCDEPIITSEFGVFGYAHITHTQRVRCGHAAQPKAEAPKETPEAAFLRGQQVMLNLIVKTTIATGVAKAHIKSAPFTPYTPPTR